MPDPTTFFDDALDGLEKFNKPKETDKDVLERICEDLKDSEANGEINVIGWMSDMICAVKEIAELGLKEALPVMNKLKEIGVILKIIK